MAEPLITYEDAALPVRTDLLEAHRGAWEHVAQAGAWWTGTERVAIASEVRAARSCALCAARKRVLAPTMARGEHDRASELPEHVVDAVHRITTDSGRIARSDLEAWTAAGLTDAHYVELVGVIVHVLCVDTVSLALASPLPDLPEPVAGAASGHRAAAAALGTAWVPMLPEGGSDPDSMELYGGRRVPHVARALSLVPHEMKGISRLAAAQYIHGPRMMDLGLGRAIARPQMELVAARVSALNECFY